MTQPTTDAKTMDDTAMPKPPLPSPFPSRKSESFRGVEYSPPGNAPSENEPEQETTSKGSSFFRRWSSNNKDMAVYTKSDDVVEELSRRQSLGSRQKSEELPPLATQSPRVTKTSPTQVALDTVTLVATETPTSEMKSGQEMNETVGEKKEKFHQASMKEGKEVEKKEEKQTPVLGKGEEAAERVEAKVEKEEETRMKTPMSPSSELSSGKPSTDVRLSTAGEATEVVQEKRDVAAVVVQSEIVKPEIHHDQPSSTAPAPTEPVEVENLTTVTTQPTAKTEEKVTSGTGELTKEKAAVGEAVRQPLHKSPTGVQPPQQQTSFLRRFFSFGGGDRTSTAEPKSPVKEEEDPAKEVDRVPATKEEKQVPAEEEKKQPESSTSAEDPSSSRSPMDAVEQPAEKIVVPPAVVNVEAGHKRTSSEITRAELDELKALFMSEMRNKGINVEGKYTKSSVDFDSPLMFLLDLHTFAVTQHSTVRMEDLLEEKYGTAHAVVAEFSAATARERETLMQAKVDEPTIPSENPNVEVLPPAPKSAEKSAPPNKSAFDMTSPMQKEEVSSPPIEQEEIAKQDSESSTIEEKEKPTQTIYEAGLDSAQDTVTEKAKVVTAATATAATTAVTNGSSSESQKQNEEAVVTMAATAKEESKPMLEGVRSHHVRENSPPVIAPSRDETGVETVAARCFMCACLFPSAK